MEDQERKQWIELVSTLIGAGISVWLSGDGGTVNGCEQVNDTVLTEDEARLMRIVFEEAD